MPCRIDVRAPRALHREAQRVVDASGRRVAAPAREAGEDRQPRGVGRRPAGRPQRVRAQVPDGAGPGRPAAALLVQCVELVEPAGIAVDDQRVTVAFVEMPRRAFDRHTGRDRVRALVALVGVVERHLRLRRRLAVHDDVRDADPRAVPEARAEVGVHGAADADRRDHRCRVGGDRQLVDRRVPDARRRKDRAAAELRRRRGGRSGQACDEREASSFTVAGVAPASRPRFA